MSKKHIVIIVPGLGDETTKIKWATAHWRKYGLKPVIHNIWWKKGNKHFKPKLIRLIHRIDNFIKKTSPNWFSTWCLPDSDSSNDAIVTLLVNIYWESTVLIKRPVAPGPLNCIRTDVFHSVGGYNEEQKYNEDVELGLHLDRIGAKLTFLRETLYVWSMRRIRRENKIKVMNQYIVSLIPILLFKRPFKVMPGYTMGGHAYTNKQKSQIAKLLRSYEKSLKRFAKELFE